MKTSRIVTILAAVAMTAAAFACSSSSNGGGGSSQCASSFGPMGSGDTQCSSCTQSNCGSQISAIESGCSDYLSCICPNGTVDENLAQQCAPKAQESSCSSAESNIGSCVSAHCATECGSGSGSGSGSGGGSGSGSGSSSGGGTGWVKASCDTQSDGVCTISSVPSADVSAFQQSCMGNGGTPGTTCPTADLVGCCTISSVEACYYGEAGPGQSGCTMGGGTWSAMP